MTGNNTILIFFLLALASGVNLSTAAPASTTTTTYENPLHEHLDANRRRVKKTLKSWRIQHAAKPKTRMIIPTQKISNKDNPLDRGFKFTIGFRPTKERISKWFGVDEDSNQIQRGMLQKQFNHDLVGVTNPFLQYGGQWSSSDTDETIAVSVSTTTSSEQQPTSASSSWWPSCFIEPREKKKWRVLTYRGTVGHGMECYQRVRDAVLDWEFQNEDGSVGLLTIPASRSNSNMDTSRPRLLRRSYSVSSTEDDEERLHRTIGNARRMVSFTSSRVPLLPALYAINPVMVVYDLVDQRGPGTTFSSTAYATMKGHLLRGEERVTVALRDRDQSVDVEVLSVSRPAGTMFAKALWPLVGKKQNTFFQLQMEFLRGIAGQRNNNNNCEDQQQQQQQQQNRLSSFPVRWGGGDKNNNNHHHQLEYDF